MFLLDIGDREKLLRAFFEFLLQSLSTKKKKKSNKKSMKLQKLKHNEKMI
jgi:hypothetical protein